MPLDGNVYINRDFHQVRTRLARECAHALRLCVLFPRLQSHHHYSKVVSMQSSWWHGSDQVVSTHYEMTSMLSSANTILGYQMLTQSQIMHYDEMDVPEAKFSYDLSPMAVVVQNKGRRWYDFITSLCAIIGGTFTVVGIFDAVLHKIIKGTKQL